MHTIDKAFKLVSRKDFLPDDLQERTDWDVPLPIGFGQTNSQPTTVRLMLEWLDPQPGDNVLDVGSGSGWTSALLACLVGPAGKVYAVETVPELVEFGRNNCQRAGVKNVSFYQAGKVIGLGQFAPYDRILVSASARKMPNKLLGQLKVGGTMVAPVLDSIFIVNKTGPQKYEYTQKPGFVFVPLV